MIACFIINLIIVSFADDCYFVTRHVASWILEILTNLTLVPFTNDNAVDLKHSSKLVLQRLMINDLNIAQPFIRYSCDLGDRLAGPVHEYIIIPSRQAKEQIWSSFHALAASLYFHEEWIKLCVAIDLPQSSTQSIIGMHVAHHILLKMIETNCSALAVNNAIGDYEGDLTENELSGLFYVAGYVIRSVRRHIVGNDESAGKQRQALDSMCSFDSIDESEESIEDSVKRWTTLSNRGGLTIATDTAFELFQIIEKICRKHLRISQLAVDHNIDVDKIEKEVMEDDDVVLLWTEMTCDHFNNDLEIETEYSSTLLKKLFTKYVSTRTHSFAKGTFEQYKPDIGRNSKPRNMSLRTGLQHAKLL